MLSEETIAPKILIVGEWRWFHYQGAFAQALDKNGAEVAAFKVQWFFPKYCFLAKRIPYLSFNLLALNLVLIMKVLFYKPNVVLLWRQTHLLRLTIRLIKLCSRATVVTYNNDDPFRVYDSNDMPWHHKFLWRRYVETLYVSDYNFFYRPINVAEALELGIDHADILLPYFIPDLMPYNPAPQRVPGDTILDVVFIGHYENDGRAEAIEMLINAGLKVQVYGDATWKDYLSKAALAKMPEPVINIYGADYVEAIRSSKISLCFFSKLNRDTYTRRCFEIPACGSMLLCEQSEAMEDMFKSDEEAVYFTSNKELVEKAIYYAKHTDIREKIVRNGHLRVWHDEHDVTSRARQFLAQVT